MYQGIGRFGNSWAYLVRVRMVNEGGNSTALFPLGLFGPSAAVLQDSDQRQAGVCPNDGTSVRDSHPAE